MKKKFLLTLLALVCALCCAFGLVACDNGDTPNGGSDTIAVESVTLNKTTLTLDIDGTETLTATVTPDNATNKTVTWSSSAPTIASVDSTGKVTAKAEGTATITAKTANDKTATCAVTVNAPAPTTEVTAAEWTAAFAVSSYTFDHITDNRTQTYELDGNKFHFDSTEHQILSIEDNKGYIYTEMNGNGWMRSDTEKETIAYMIETYSNVLLSVKDSYLEFTYTESKYVANQLNITIEAMGMNIVSAEITFENKNLVSVKLTTTTMGTFSFEKFGTTTITLPTNYTESDN